MGRSSEQVKVAGRTLRLTNLDKVYWQGDGYTKRDLVRYYLSVAPWLLPHLKDRPLVLTRYPDGIEGKSFYQKQAPRERPAWLPTCPVPAEKRAIDFLLATEPAALAWLANHGAIEIHPFFSRCGRLDQVDFAVIDIDPAEGASWDDVRLVARLVRSASETLGLRLYPKTSGATGLHLYLPLATGHGYLEARAFAEGMAHLIHAHLPERVTLERMVARRAGKVYIDWLQNMPGKTITSVYGVRPLPGAPVSTPIGWDELDHVRPAQFTIRTVPARLAERGDLFAPVLTDRQSLARVLPALAGPLRPAGQVVAAPENFGHRRSKGDSHVPGPFD